MSAIPTKPELLEAATRLAYCGQRLIECAGLVKAAVWDGKAPTAYVRSTLNFEQADLEMVIKTISRAQQREVA